MPRAWRWNAASSSESRRALFQRQQPAAALAVAGGLQAPRLGSRPLGGVDRFGIAGGVLVHARRAMADPLPPHVHRHAHVQLELAHLERRRVSVPHQVADEAAVLVPALGAPAVGRSRRLHDGRVVAHVVDDAHEPVVQHANGLPQHGIELCDRRAGDPLGTCDSSGIPSCPLPGILSRLTPPRPPRRPAPRRGTIGAA